MGREGGGGVRGALIERRLEMNPKLVIDRSADQRVKAGNRGRGSLNSTLLHRSSLLLSAQCRGATEFVCFFTEFLIVVDEPSSIPGRCCWLVFFFSQQDRVRLPGFTGFFSGLRRQVAQAGGAGWGRRRPRPTSHLPAFRSLARVHRRVPPHLHTHPPTSGTGDARRPPPTERPAQPRITPSTVFDRPSPRGKWRPISFRNAPIGCCANMTSVFC